MKNITPFLWFDKQAEEAVQFYTSIFPDSKIGAITRYSEGVPGPQGSVMTVNFTLKGQPFMALNGGPQFKFTEAVSFMVNCDMIGRLTGDRVEVFGCRSAPGLRRILCDD